MQQITLQLAVSGSSNTSGSGSSSGGGTTSGSTGGGGTSTSSGPFSITSLTSNRTSPQAPGTLITFTAAASGGRSPYQFKWLVYDGRTWTVVRNWSSSNTFTWSTPAREGAYRVGIWARDATMTADVGTYNLNVVFRSRGTGSTAATPPPPVTAPSAPVSSPTPISGPLVVAGLTSSVGSPQAPGTQHHVHGPGHWRHGAVSNQVVVFRRQELDGAAYLEPFHDIRVEADDHDHRRTSHRCRSTRRNVADRRQPRGVVGPLQDQVRQLTRFAAPRAKRRSAA